MLEKEIDSIQKCFDFLSLKKKKRPKHQRIDPAIPTISTNVENTEHGHCAKTLVILQNVWEEILTNEQLKQIKYIVLCDDDTLLR